MSYEKADDFQRWGQYLEVGGLGAAEPARPWGGEIPQGPVNPNLVEIYPNTPADPWAEGGEGTFAPGKLMDSLEALFGLAKPTTTVVDPKTGTVLIAPKRPVSKIPALVLLGGLGVAAYLLTRSKKKEA